MMDVNSAVIGAIIGAIVAIIWLMLRSRSSRADSTQHSRPLGREKYADDLSDVDERMAYGQYAAAAEQVLRAIEAEPRRASIKMKLLELYFVWGNTNEFRAAADRFAPSLRGTDHWAKVRIMGGQLCPDDPLFL